jgi:hypothetical protein
MINIVKNMNSNFTRDVTVIRGAKVACVRCGFKYEKYGGNISKVNGKWICRWDINPEDYRGVNKK